MRRLLLLPLAGLLLLAVIATAFILPISGQDLILVTPVPTSTAAVELLTNGGFEIDGDLDGVPDGWLLSNADRDWLVCKNDDCVFRFSGLATTLMQKIKSGGDAGDRLVLSFFTRATEDWKGRDSYVILKIINADGTVNGMVIGLDGGASYVRAEGQTHALKDFTRLNVKILARSPTGRLWVDDVSLTRNIP